MNPFADRTLAAKPRPEPQPREPREPRPPERETTRASAMSKPLKPQPEPAAQAKPPLRGADKTRHERSQGNTPGSATKRSDEPPSASPDGLLFSALLDSVPTPPAFNGGGVELHTQPRFTHETAHSAPATAPMALWQPLEAELGRIADRQLDGPVAMTLLLPRLGAVDARLQHLPAGGWDIALRFSPAALNALEAHQERCRQALRRRMASRVRLRFEQRGAA
ncbi:type III secretion system HrpP C-terminal domain-containing protein [Pantoea alhagi]|uniref:type III secretion system HrpP C-terminal domain-containing protein n=1 Tax=Pantoea alhagi TaxID=1891675 RepID=UPI00202B3E69|nr:type III secretion system HrpP C-terminal domain-containing protein [Pantoea alhagi]URQ61341.1 type III secretion system HrpP C-terminal domain-containing protein [Pantoea alhagi]